MRKPSTLNTLGALSILALQLFTGLTAAFQATRHIERRGVISTLAKQHGGCFQDNFKQRHGTVLNIYMTSNREDESAGSVILLRQAATGDRFQSYSCKGSSSSRNGYFANDHIRYCCGSVGALD